MGWGDALLAAGQARVISELSGKRVAIGNPDTESIEWNELYDCCPHVTKDTSGPWIKDHAGHRGYMLGSRRIPDGRMLQMFYNMDYRAVPCVLDVEAAKSDYIIIEPSKKDTAPLAKLWGEYQKVVDSVDADFVQLNQDTLSGVDRLDTTLLEAARLMKGARAYIGTEGFLHHLAAAFNKPAVVLMGAFVPPTVLGYKSHINMAVDDPSELGHCANTGAMLKIPAEAVVKALNDALVGRRFKHTLRRCRGDYFLTGWDIRYFF